MKHFYCRPNETKFGKFLEFYLVYKGNCLGLPEAPVERFAGRILSTAFVGPLVVILVHSIVPALTLRTLEQIKTGAWCSESDLAIRPPGTGVASYYGVHIQPLDLDINAIYASMPTIFPDGPKCEPLVVYHGTSRDSVKAIIKEGFKVSPDGMLGPAIYFGSFWKAMRFATMTQDYTKRPGAILRCYVFWQKTVFRGSYSNEYCKCPKCSKQDFNCDHLGLWTKFGDSIFVWPRDNSTLKNEEYACLNDDRVIIDSVAHAIAQTQHHEPDNRTLSIL